MMSHTPAYLECPINNGHRLRVEFHELGDRYAHRLTVVLREEAGNETVVPLAESVEGASDDPWPPSPPLQSLSIEELADGRMAALLVGMAGRSHWSASIDVIGVRLNGEPTFELACRFTAIPTRLCSTYRVAPGIVLREHKGVVNLAHPKAGIIAVLHSDVCRPILNLETGEFQFQVPLDKLIPPATAQWRYVLEAKQVDSAEVRKKLTA